MSIEKRLGKIKSISLGAGGYDDAMFGVTFEFSGGGWGVGDFWGTWSREPKDHEEREKKIKLMGEIMLRLSELMKEAKVDNINDLVNIPIEVTFDGMVRTDWRILTEVL